MTVIEDRFMGGHQTLIPRNEMNGAFYLWLIVYQVVDSF